MKSIRERLADEQGVALFYALLVVLIVGSVVAVTFAAALGEQRQVTSELQFEDTIHVAESGAEEALEAVLVATESGSSAFSNAAAPGCDAGVVTDCSEAEQRDWAVAEASDPSYTPVRLSEGESVGLRPAGSLAQYVYGVGFVPTRDAFLADAPRSYARVVRMQVLFTSGVQNGTFTFLADEIIDVNGGGNSTVVGAIHSNNEIEPANSGQWTIYSDIEQTLTGKVTYIGDCNGCVSDANVIYERTTTGVPIRFGTARDLYDSDTAVELVTNNTVPWYDYCGSTWRVRDDATEDPCSGPVAGGSIGFSGTTLQGNANGVYYFNAGEDVDLTGNNTGMNMMSVITEGDVELPGGNRDLNFSGSAYPDLFIFSGGDVTGSNGNPTVNGYLAGIAEGVDLDGDGEPDLIDPGIIYARNNITISGTSSSFQVSWIAGNQFRLNGGGGGTFSLSGVANVDTGTPATPSVSAWQEL